MGASAWGWNAVLWGEQADPQHESREFEEEEVGEEVEQVGILGQREDAMPGGCDCIPDTGDSERFWEGE